MLKSFGLGILLALVIIYGGWVFQTLYTWFIIPVFHLENISVIQAIGIQTFCVLFAKTEENKEKSSSEYIQSLLLRAVVNLTVILMFGWFLNLFM